MTKALEFAVFLVHISLLLSSLSVVVLIDTSCSISNSNVGSFQEDTRQLILSTFIPDSALRSTLVDSSCAIHAAQQLVFQNEFSGNLLQLAKTDGDLAVLLEVGSSISFACEPDANTATTIFFDTITQEIDSTVTFNVNLLESGVTNQERVNVTDGTSLSKEGVADLIEMKGSSTDCTVVFSNDTLYFEPEEGAAEIFDRINGLAAFFDSNYCQNKSIVDALIFCVYAIEPVRGILAFVFLVFTSRKAGIILQVLETVSSGVRITIVYFIDDIFILIFTALLFLIDVIITVIYLFEVKGDTETEASKKAIATSAI